MDAIEKQYFSKPRNHIAMRHYISSLIDSGRIIEASFFCEKMLLESQKNKYANKLAFIIAIKRMDPSVAKYDEALANSGMSNKERYILHCRYYFSLHNKKGLKDSLNAVMDEELSDLESLSVVLEGLLWLKDIYLARKFISLYLRGGSQISPRAEKELKSILLARLGEIFLNIYRSVRG
ncbi:hypothetical protein [Burkholderia sp. Cy-637]|uniref:hypothetical protein n=1 Tax=Burkholderia sp. Cy-637 TaxID=2608327 RepID=UPI00141D9CC5|nr:hypothetical protein [Burkholderia sp. Cy-637]NIF88115.1 hypothetical protein [Burkholderia sp. Cy-637]